MKRFYTVEQAGAILAGELIPSESLGPRVWSQKIIRAILDGTLIGVFQGSALDPKTPGATVAVTKCEVRADDLNKWLESIRCRVQLPLDIELQEETAQPGNGTAPAEQAAPLDEAVGINDSAAKNKFVKGIDKQQVIAAFEGLYFNADQWSKYTASPPQWLIKCRIAKGSKSISATWDPVKIALELSDTKRGILVQKLSAVFREKGFLAPWENEWKEASDYLS